MSTISECFHDVIILVMNLKNEMNKCENIRNMLQNLVLLLKIRNSLNPPSNTFPPRLSGSWNSISIPPLINLSRVQSLDLFWLASVYISQGLSTV